MQMPDCWLEFSMRPEGPATYQHGSRFRVSVVFLGLRANIEFVPKFHIALHALHAPPPPRNVNIKISP
jgi:hypothetical protein